MSYLIDRDVIDVANATLATTDIVFSDRSDDAATVSMFGKAVGIVVIDELADDDQELLASMECRLWGSRSSWTTASKDALYAALVEVAGRCKCIVCGGTGVVSCVPAVRCFECKGLGYTKEDA